MARQLTGVRGGATRKGGAPSASPDTPPVPDWLNDRAATIWRALVPHIPPGRLTHANADLFAMYCNTLATYREADQIIEQAGVLIAAGQDLIPNPALSIRVQADSMAARWAKTFGLTPDTAPAAPQGEQRPRKLPHLVEGGA